MRKLESIGVERWQALIRNINGILPALLACALPLSTSAVTVLAALILLLWLLEGEYRYKAELIFANPVARAVLLYLTILIIGLAWSPDFIAGLHVLGARWKTALFCVFLTVVVRRSRTFYIGGYLIGLTVAMVMTYLAWFGLLQYSDVSEHHLTHRTFHVVYNPLLAFGIYLVLHELIWRKELAKGWRLALAALAVAMIMNMFITDGRTGQLVFFVLMALLLLQIFHRHRFIALLAISFLVPAMFGIGYTMSPIFKARINQAQHEVAIFHSNPNTSVGQRLLFWQNSWRIIREHPWVGVGTGGFKAIYAQINREQSPNSIATDNPHNQYVLVCSMLGIPGIVSLFLIFVAMFREALRRKDHWFRVRVAFPVFFLVIMFTESYLRIHETGFFFSLFGAVFYSRTGRSLKNFPEKKITGNGKDAVNHYDRGTGSARVAIIHNQFRSGGGMESYLLALVRGFQAVGDEVHIYTYDADLALAEQLGCHIHKSHLFFLPGRWKKYYFLALCNRTFDRSQYDLVLSLTRTCAAHVAVVGGVHPAFVQQRDRPGRGIRWLHDRLEIRFEAIMLAHTPIILAHAQGLAREINVWYPDTDPKKVSVCYPPIDTDFFRPASQERLTQIRLAYGIQNSRLCLLFPSRGHRRKGLTELIQAFARLDPDRYELLVAGESMRGFGKIPSNVRYLGHIENLSDLYSAVDYTVLPSHYEPFGLVVVESLHCGTPVLVSRQVGAAELLSPSEGVILDTLTPETLAETIGGLKKMRVAPGFIKRHGLNIEEHIQAIKNLMATQVQQHHNGV